MLNQAEDFLRRLFDGQPSDRRLTVWSGTSKLSAHLLVDDIARAARWAERLDARGEDAYVGCALRRSDLEDATKRGGKADLVALPGLWVDLDVGTEGHKAANLPPTLEDAATLLEGLPEPTMAISSGGGLHAWWLFPEALELVGDEKTRAGRTLAEATLKALQGRVIAAAAARGWHADSLPSLDRVLRIPGTRNHKLDEPRPVDAIFLDGPRHDLEALASLLSIDPDHLEATGADAARVAPADGGAGGGELPDPPLTIDQVRDRLRRLSNEAQRARFRKVLAGESFAPRGERDQAMQSVVSTAAFVAPDAEAEELAEIFRPSLATWAGEEGSDKTVEQEMEKLVGKMQRALVDARRKRDLRRAAEREIAAGLIEESGEAIAGGEAAPGAPRAPGPDGYTDEDLADFAARCGCTVKALRRRWIIQRASSYYVLVGGEYRSPITREELDVSLPRDLSAAPVSVFVDKQDGGRRRRKTTEILADHATVARRIVADLTAPRSRYEPKTQTFVEAVAPLRPIAPAFHAQVDQWLRLLGGVEADKLLDWIATLTNLERQTCALYLSRTPGAGKGMLADGLARLWTTGGPSELGRVLDNFNADLARCPLIFGDEHLPEKFRGQRSSAELRALIGSSTRTLSRKFLANAELRGAVRLLLAANNDRMLALGDEDLGAADLAAIAGRFLHVDVDDAPARFLSSLGGRKGTDGWVDRDLIAAHALWLRDNRVVVAGDRFLVEGRATRMHRMLATQGKVPGLVTEWIARYLDSPKPHVAGTKHVLMGDGELLVNATALVDHWDVYVSSDGVPNTTRIGRALEHLSRGVGELGGVSYHMVDVELVYEWARANQVGNLDEMRARVDRPTDGAPTAAPEGR